MPLEKKNCISEVERNEILTFAKKELEKKDVLPFKHSSVSCPPHSTEKKHYRGDYLELIELSVMLLVVKKRKGNKFKIRPPGAMHQARFMARAIYILKMFLLRKELKLPLETEKRLQEICLFIVKFYLKAWIQCTHAAKAPHQDFQFLKKINDYEDRGIAKAVVNKLSLHLWYLSEESVALAFFDDSVDVDVKIKMSRNLSIDGNGTDHRYHLNPTDVDTFLGEL